MVPKRPLIIDESRVCSYKVLRPPTHCRSIHLRVLGCSIPMARIFITFRFWSSTLNLRTFISSNVKGQSKLAVPLIGGFTVTNRIWIASYGISSTHNSHSFNSISTHRQLVPDRKLLFHRSLSEPALGQNILDDRAIRVCSFGILDCEWEGEDSLGV